MLSRGAYAFWVLAMAAALTLPSAGQSVVSTHSGIVHFFEGTVYLSDQPLESHPGRFPSVPQGGELRTDNGRAELLLTPGVILRLGEKSSIRLLSNALSNTRVELLSGSSVLDSGQPNSGTSVRLIYKNWSMSFPEQGLYRIDCDPPRLWVLQGKAEVAADANPIAVSVDKGMYMPFAAVLVPEPSIDPPHDALSSWAQGRQQSISADNAIAANIQDPGSMDASNSSPGSFTNFPMLGLSPIGPDLSSIYNSPSLNQPGFNSLYLPGYSYLPFEPGLLSTYSLLGAYPVFVVPGYGPRGVPTSVGVPRYPGVLPLSHGPVAHPIAVHPVSSPHPAPAHSVSGFGAHMGGRR
jgi:hypothetical protein